MNMNFYKDSGFQCRVETSIVDEVDIFGNIGNGKSEIYSRYIWVGIVPNESRLTALPRPGRLSVGYPHVSTACQSDGSPGRYLYKPLATKLASLGIIWGQLWAPCLENITAMYKYFLFLQNFQRVSLWFIMARKNVSLSDSKWGKLRRGFEGHTNIQTHEQRPVTNHSSEISTKTKPRSVYSTRGEIFSESY